MTSRKTGTAPTTTLAWDTRNRLTTTTTTTGPTTNTYTTSNQRLIRTNPDGSKTLYLDNQELTRAAGGGAITAKRYYTIGTAAVALRDNNTANNAVTWLLGNHQGTLTRTIPNTTASTPTINRYKPYGNTRTSTDPITTTDRGFLGQTEDASTQLTYLTNRSYESALGAFVAVDPLLNPADVRTMNPYVYAAGNPVSYADAAGLCFGAADAGSFGLDVVIDCRDDFNTTDDGGMRSVDAIDFLAGCEICDPTQYDDDTNDPSSAYFEIKSLAEGLVDAETRPDSSFNWPVFPGVGTSNRETAIRYYNRALPDLLETDRSAGLRRTQRLREANSVATAAYLAELAQCDGRCEVLALADFLSTISTVTAISCVVAVGCMFSAGTGLASGALYILAGSPADGGCSLVATGVGYESKGAGAAASAACSVYGSM